MGDETIGSEYLHIVRTLGPGALLPDAADLGVPVLAMICPPLLL